MDSNKFITGWKCPACNTFWRDEVFAGKTNRDKCPFCNIERKDGEEIVLRRVFDADEDEENRPKGNDERE